MKKTHSIILLAAAVLLLCSEAAYSQGTSEIYLFKMKTDRGLYTFDNPVKVSTEAGYNNQPSFHPDGSSLLYSSDQAGQNTDIYIYDLVSGKRRALTSTPDSEYSPLVIPGEAKFSVIQLVITEGPRKGAQPLLAFPLAGGNPELLYEDGEKVGYHAWLGADRVAMFVLGSPHFLQVVNLKTKETFKVAEDIGRSIYKIPGKEVVSYSQNREGEPGLIMAFNLDTHQSVPVTSLREGNDFYAWTPSGKLVMAVGAELFTFDPLKDKEWQKAADFSSYGLRRITRLAVSPDESWIALVNNR